MTTSDPAPLPPGDRQRFSDPAAEPFYAAIKSLDLASQHQPLRALHVKLHAEDVAAEGTHPTAPRMQPYTREEVIRAVRRCALELACRPSSTTYVRWRRGSAASRA
jgi:hypothetical protein